MFFLKFTQMNDSSLSCVQYRVRIGSNIHSIQYRNDFLMKMWESLVRFEV